MKLGMFMGRNPAAPVIAIAPGAPIAPSAPLLLYWFSGIEQMDWFA
jgi:hypothetical protein